MTLRVTSRPLTAIQLAFNKAVQECVSQKRKVNFKPSNPQQQPSSTDQCNLTKSSEPWRSQ